MSVLVNVKMTSQKWLRGSSMGQFLLLLGLWMAGCKIASGTGAPVPGAVIGLGLALLLLATRVLDLPDIERVCGWLISEMLLFFIPAVLALVVHPELLGWLGAKVLVVIVGSTVMVMVATAATIEVSTRFLGGRER